MNATQHISNNAVLGAPADVSIEDCSALPITRVIFKVEPEQKIPGEAVVSFWKPTVIELELLKAGKSVRITVWGATHPPIAIGVEFDGCYPEPM